MEFLAHLDLPELEEILELLAPFLGPLVFLGHLEILVGRESKDQ